MFAGDTYARAAVFIGVIGLVIAVTVLGIFITVRATRRATRSSPIPVARVRR